MPLMWRHLLAVVSLVVTGAFHPMMGTEARHDAPRISHFCNGDDILNLYQAGDNMLSKGFIKSPALTDPVDVTPCIINVQNIPVNGEVTFDFPIFSLANRINGTCNGASLRIFESGSVSTGPSYCGKEMQNVKFRSRQPVTIEFTPAAVTDTFLIKYSVEVVANTTDLTAKKFGILSSSEFNTEIPEHTFYFEDLPPMATVTFKAMKISLPASTAGNCNADVANFKIYSTSQEGAPGISELCDTEEDHDNFVYNETVTIKLSEFTTSNDFYIAYWVQLQKVNFNLDLAVNARGIISSPEFVGEKEYSYTLTLPPNKRLQLRNLKANLPTMTAASVICDQTKFEIYRMSGSTTDPEIIPQTFCEASGPIWSLEPSAPEIQLEPITFKFYPSKSTDRFLIEYRVSNLVAPAP